MGDDEPEPGPHGIPQVGFCFLSFRFDAAEWVAAIKAAGAKYICFTTRHHEGFSMFDSRFTDYNIVKATPFGRDVLKELAEECHKQGIKLHLYYSHLIGTGTIIIRWGGPDVVRDVRPMENGKRIISL